MADILLGIKLQGEVGVFGWLGRIADQADLWPARKLSRQQIHRIYTLVVGTDRRPLSFGFVLWTPEKACCAGAGHRPGPRTRHATGPPRSPNTDARRFVSTEDGIDGSHRCASRRRFGADRATTPPGVCGEHRPARPAQDRP